MGKKSRAKAERRAAKALPKGALLESALRCVEPEYDPEADPLTPGEFLVLVQTIRGVQRRGAGAGGRSRAV